MRKVTVLNPRGYCSGVSRAISIALKARKENPDKNVFVLGELVHNSLVIDMLNKNNIITLKGDNKKDIIQKLEEGSILVFTAHGHDKKLDEIAKNKNLVVYDATCMKVKSNLNKIENEINKNNQVIFIGQKSHPEVNAALSLSSNVVLYDIEQPFNYYKITNNNVFVINQTTLNFVKLNKIFEEIKSHIPNAIISNEICNTTRIRQNSVLNIPSDADLIIVIGDKISSNSNKLLDIAKENHPTIKSVLIKDKNDLDDFDILNYSNIYIVSSASTPPETVNELEQYIISL
ncbi:MAG: 4-hydroxy-3-methylbut-2-enyl diphosphate reductase [Bacilli bacterium]